jgi:hypothetical protein
LCKYIFMKHILYKLLTLAFYCIASSMQANAQSIDFKNKEEQYTRMDNADIVYYAAVSVTGSLRTAVNNVAVTISRNDGTAGDYTLGSSSFSLAAMSGSCLLPINIKRGKPTKAADTVLLHFTDPLTDKIRSLYIAITAAEQNATGKGIKNIMYLNAYNFDFGDTKLSSNYVGHLNFYLPSTSKNKKWGFNTGVMKISYGQKDTSLDVAVFVKENALIDAFDTVRDGLKYLRKVNTYNTSRSNTVWSFYVQPFYELTQANDNFKVYAHLHLELLASKWSSTTTATTIKQDTAVYNAATDNNMLLRYTYSNSNTYTVHSVSGYFGAGFTFDVKPWDDGSFFFQPTWGITSNKPSNSSIDINTLYTPTRAEKTDRIRRLQGFYLVRAYYTHNLVKEKSTVVVGVDIRGLIQLHAPQYAVYAGLNLSLDAVLGLIKGDK